MQNFSKHKWWFVTIALTLPAVAAAAGVPKLFSPNTAISSADVNANFANLAERISAIEAQNATSPQVLTASSGVTQTLGFGQDGAYSGTYLDLPAGKWLLQGQASVSTQVSPDAVRIGLFNDTAKTLIAGSAGSMVSTTALNILVTLSSSPVSVTVTSTTRIRLFGLRHGASTLVFGTSVGLRQDFVADVNRIVATPLR